MPRPEGSRRAEGFFRLLGLIKKEFLQIVRDPSSVAIAFLLPAVLLFIFGYGVSLDAERVPVGLVLESHSPQAASLAGDFQSTRWFSARRFPGIQAAEQALLAGEIQAVVWLPEQFSRRLLQGAGAPIRVIINGVDANTARIVSGYVQGVWNLWLARLARARGLTPSQPLEMEQRVRFNQEVRSTNYLVPGLIAVIMTLIGALLTSLVVAREWERGTMEVLLVSPARIGEILLGKLIPYFLLGLGGLAVSMTMAVGLFQVPLRGSVLALLGASSLFLLAALGMGLIISTATRNQFVSGQLAIVVTFLPAFILSGFVFDINSMPLVVQWITRVIAARYYVEILQSLFLAGDIWPVLLANSAALAIMAGVFLALVRLMSKRRLD